MMQSVISPLSGLAFSPHLLMSRVVGVRIDIESGSGPNCFNYKGNGVIPVAILGSADLDVTTIKPAAAQLASLAVRLAGKSNKLLIHFEDVNSDSFLDHLVRLSDCDGVFQPESTSAKLAGKLFDVTTIEASDTICIVP